MRSSGILSLENRDGNPGGYTLIEMLIGMGLMAALSLAVGAASIFSARSSQRTNLGPTRDQLVALVRESAGDLRALRLALMKPENSSFYQCVCSGACTSMQTNAFTLYDSSGSVQSPMYFDAMGIPCSSASASCFIKVTTSFLAECAPTLPSANPVPPLTCVAPSEFVEVTYTIDQNPATLAQGKLLQPIQGGVFTQVADLAPTGSGVCP